MDKIQQNQAVSMQNHFELTRELFQVNLLSNYILSDQMIENWTLTVVEICKDITPEILKMLIDKMKGGYLDFDSKLGVRNIVNAYFRYKNDKNFKIDAIGKISIEAKTPNGNFINDIIIYK